MAKSKQEQAAGVQGGVPAAGGLEVGEKIVIRTNQTADPANQFPKVDNHGPRVPFIRGEGQYSYEARLPGNFAAGSPVRFRSDTFHPLELVAVALRQMGVTQTGEKVEIRRLTAEEVQESLDAEADMKRSQQQEEAERQRLRAIDRQKAAMFGAAE
jgi:hypothetical protein